MFPITKTTCLLLLALISMSGYTQRYSVLIHEIMADPKPPVGLPDAEYVELKNTSAIPIHLTGWRLQTSTSKSGLLPFYTLMPDSLVVITSRSDTGLFGTNTVGVASFPALPNTGTTLLLLDASGNMVHAVAYQKSWYKTALKAAGGWSLEMMDAANHCGGAANWKEANDPAGGTPGRPNSVAARNRDETPPALLAALAVDNTHLMLLFDEPLDNALAAVNNNCKLEPFVDIVSAAAVPPLFDQVILTLGTPLQEGQVYTLQVAGIKDCTGNVIGVRNEVRTGLPQPAQPGNVVINELLFHPKADGSDYVELYNKSNRIIDLSRLTITNRTTSGALGTPQKACDSPFYLFPGAYAVLTADRDAVLRGYLVKATDALIATAKFPSLPNDKGCFVLLNEQGEVLDEVQYKEDWHFALIQDPQGIALERIDPEKPTQQPGNWTSAAATAGFGTPTYRNSQFKQYQGSHATLAINPKIISPDNDGIDDFCTISFQLAEPNYVANLTIFDAGGRKMRHLVQNQTLAQGGSWRWDGLGANGKALPTGTYILLLELFNLQGKQQQLRQWVVIARK